MPDAPNTKTQEPNNLLIVFIIYMLSSSVATCTLVSIGNAVLPCVPVLWQPIVSVSGFVLLILPVTNIYVMLSLVVGGILAFMLSSVLPKE